MAIVVSARFSIALLLSVTGSLWSSPARALPTRGTVLPPLEARDLHGKSRPVWSSEGQRVLLVVLTDQAGSGQMRSWLGHAARRAPEVRRVGVLSLQLPFFINEGTARGSAQARIPRHQWVDYFLDGDGTMARALGLAPGPTVWALVVDSRGHVLAAAHGDAEGPLAAGVWRALHPPLTRDRLIANDQTPVRATAPDAGSF